MQQHEHVTSHTLLQQLWAQALHLNASKLLDRQLGVCVAFNEHQQRRCSVHSQLPLWRPHHGRHQLCDSLGSDKGILQGIGIVREPRSRKVCKDYCRSPLQMSARRETPCVADGKVLSLASA